MAPSNRGSGHRSSGSVALFQRQFSSGGIVFKKSRLGARVALICRGGGTIWCLPKGRIEKGEKPEETALREVQEETGLTGSLVKKLGDIRYRYTSKEERTRFLKSVSFFLIRHTGGSTKEHDFEVDEAAWFSLEEAIRKLSYPSERRLMKKAMRLLLNP